MSGDDFFESDEHAIVDCDILEAAKENVQPLATGRKVTTLSSVLATPHALRESKLASTRQRLRINVELALEDDDETADPLDAYCRFVDWTLENYPEGNSAESGLMELLEEATRVLKDHRGRIWRKELRYLKLWLLYASFVEKPTVIYRFILANEVCTDEALLYEEYAAVLERDGRRKEADEIYLLGIARRASPSDHLKKRHAEFQKRMMCAAPLPAPEPAPIIQVGNTRRTVLATTSSSSGSLPPSSSVQSQPSSSRPRANGAMQVFVDPTGDASRAAEFETNPWPELGTRKERIKENVPESKQFAGTKIKQAGKTKRMVAAGSGSKIAVYRDPEPREMPPPPPPEVKSSVVPSTPTFTPYRDETASVMSPAPALAPESVMKVKKVVGKNAVPSTEAEALRRDPLKNYGSSELSGIEQA